MILNLACFWLTHSPYSHYLCRATDIAALRTILTSVVMTQCWTENRTQSPSPQRVDALRVLPQPWINGLQRTSMKTNEQRTMNIYKLA